MTLTLTRSDPGTVLFATGTLTWFALFTSLALAAPPGALPFGVYDPNGGFTDDRDVQIEHLFLPWEDVFLPSLLQADEYAQERRRNVLVTIEPWTWTRNERNTSATLIEGIFNGTYDANMREICKTLAGFKSPVTIRWAQEMDDTSGQFIWAQWNPETYVAAYRRVVDICRAESDQFDYMWSPLGFETMAQFYPGDDYVDVVGLSVFGLQDWEQKILGGEQSFDDIFAPRYQRALEFGLPVVIAELGYVGDAAYVEKWNQAVRSRISEYPELRAVLYFNQQEVYPWPDDFGLPDWQFPQNTLEPREARLSD